MEIRYFVCDRCGYDGQDKKIRLHQIKLIGSVNERIIHLCDNCIERISLELPEINFVLGKKMTKEKNKIFK